MVADGWYIYWDLRGRRRVLEPGKRMPTEVLDIVGPARTVEAADAFAARRGTPGILGAPPRKPEAADRR